MANSPIEQITPLSYVLEPFGCSAQRHKAMVVEAQGFMSIGGDGGETIFPDPHCVWRADPSATTTDFSNRISTINTSI